MEEKTAALLREAGINVTPLITMVEKALSGFDAGTDIYTIARELRRFAPPVSFSVVNDAVRSFSDSVDYINAHKEAWDCLNDGQLLSDFVSRLSWRDVAPLLPGEEGAWNDVSSRTELLTSNITIHEFIQLYESVGPPKKTYRTAARSDVTTDYPKEMAVITDKRYQYAMTFHRGERAYLLQLRSMEGIIDNGDNGLVFKKGELRSRITRDGLNDVDITLLGSIYSLILAEYRKECINDKGRIKKHKVKPITLYFPQFLKYLGIIRNFSQDNANAMLSTIKRFSNVIGYLQTTEKDQRDYQERPVARYYPALLLTDYNVDNNTITLASPYLAKLVNEIIYENIKRKKTGEMLLGKDETIKYNPSHSFLIKPTIAKQRNKAAVENVYIIVALIEQAGNPKKNKKTITPSITASELISRNETLRTMLDDASSNSHKTKTLHRCFEKTYELLRDETWLLDKYKGLKMPTEIPTARTVNTLTLKFPHGGRKEEEILD